MKLKQLEGHLGNLEQFTDPKIDLEQYPTRPHIASRMIYTAETAFGDITGKVVADFGCGCGTLGIASSLMDAEHLAVHTFQLLLPSSPELSPVLDDYFHLLNRYVIGIDVDSLSLETTLSNAEDLELNVDLVQCDIHHLEWRGPVVDTVVMNPPFGTRKKGSDMDFLSKALKIAAHAVYSLHKSSTRDHIKRAALRDFNAKSAEVLCELRFDVPQLYKFHKKKEVDIAVDLWRFTP